MFNVNRRHKTEIEKITHMNNDSSVFLKLEELLRNERIRLVASNPKNAV